MTQSRTPPPQTRLPTRCHRMAFPGMPSFQYRLGRRCPLKPLPYSITAPTPEQARHGPGQTGNSIEPRVVALSECHRFSASRCFAGGFVDINSLALLSSHPFPPPYSYLYKASFYGDYLPPASSKTQGCFPGSVDIISCFSSGRPRLGGSLHALPLLRRRKSHTSKTWGGSGTDGSMGQRFVRVVPSAMGFLQQCHPAPNPNCSSGVSLPVAAWTPNFLLFSGPVQLLRPPISGSSPLLRQPVPSPAAHPTVSRVAASTPLPRLESHRCLGADSGNCDCGKSLALDERLNT